jgi:hypothetical protein
VDFAEPESLQTRLEFLGKVLEALPAGNKVILEHLMDFLFTVSTHRTNCMTIPNIAIVFAPNLMRPRVERIESILTNSSSVNMIISLLIQHHEVLFRGKEFVEDDAGAEVVLSPQLISLKLAQSIHGKTGGSTPAIRTTTTTNSADGDKPPISPRGEKPPASLNASTPGAKRSTPATAAANNTTTTRRGPADKPMKRSQTVSSPTSSSASDPKKKLKREKSAAGGPEDDFSDITVEDLDSAALALEGTSSATGSGSGGAKLVRRKKSRRGNMSSGGGSGGVKDDQFFDTLKKGTMRLAATLLEEQEMVLEIAELEGLTAEEKAALQAKVAKKITESKTLRDNTRKQRQVQRTQSNFTKLRELKPSNGHKRSVSSDKASGAAINGDDATGSAKKTSKKPRKPNGTTGSGEISAALHSPHSPSPAQSSLDLSHSETSSVADNDMPELELDPAMAQFEEELDRQLSMEEDKPLAKLLESSSDDSDEEDIDYELLNAILPPPLPIPGAISGDAAWAGSSAPIGGGGDDTDPEEEERVAEAVMEGDMQHFQEYLGQMKRKKRLERTASSKKILSRMSINMGSPSTSSIAPQ